MPKKELTHQIIKGMKPPEKAIAYYDEVESGLILRLSKAGTKTFAYRYRFAGKNRRFTIGKFPAVSLSEARKEVQRLKVEVNRGNDPQAKKQAKKNRPEPKKFEDLVKQFKAKHLPTLKASTQKTYSERIDSELLPVFEGRPVKDISRGQIMELLEEIAYVRGKPTHSNRVRAILSSMYSFGVQREIAEDNPVKTIKPLGKEIKRERVLTEAEIKKLWELFSTMIEPSGSLLKILLLLGQRKGETSSMKWNQVKDNIWTIPKEQTKAGRKHYVPLPPLAIEIIKRLENDSPYVFQSYLKKGEPIKWINGGFNQLAEEAGITDIRIHDLRRTAATYMAELGVDRTILGKVLNHKGLAGDSQVTARYDRYSYMDEKEQALNRWSYKLQQIIEGKTETKITKLG